jgi:hypothetical protein
MAKTARNPRRKTLVAEPVEQQDLELENAEVEHNDSENVDPENANLDKSVVNDGSDVEGQYEIEKVVMHHPKSATADSEVKKYTVKWLGFDEIENTIEPKANLADCKKIVKTYWEAKKVEQEAKQAKKQAKQEEQEEGEQGEIEAVLEHYPKHATDDSGAKKYMVKWLGYCEEENTIEPRDNLDGCKYLIDEYWKAKHEAMMSAKKKTSSRRASKKSLGNKSAEKTFVGKEQKRSSIADVLAAAAKVDAVETESEKMEEDKMVVPADVVPLESYNSHMMPEPYNSHMVPENMEVTDDKTLELCDMSNGLIHETSTLLNRGEKVDTEKSVSQLNFSDDLEFDDDLLNSKEIVENIENKENKTKTPKAEKQKNDVDSAVILNQLEPSKSLDNEHDHKIASSAMKKLSINATVTKIKPVTKHLSAPKKRAKMSMPFLLEEMNKGYAEENEFLRSLAENKDMPPHLSNEINIFLSRYNEEF